MHCALCERAIAAAEAPTCWDEERGDWICTDCQAHVEMEDEVPWYDALFDDAPSFDYEPLPNEEYT